MTNKNSLLKIVYIIHFSVVVPLFDINFRLDYNYYYVEILGLYLNVLKKGSLVANMGSFLQVLSLLTLLFYIVSGNLCIIQLNQSLITKIKEFKNDFFIFFQHSFQFPVDSITLIMIWLRGQK